MEISSTNTSIYSAVSTTQTASNTQNTSSSFNTLVNTSNQETTVTTPKTSRIVNFLEKFNKLNSLSPTDEKIFRDLLSDDKLTKEEVKTLSFDQIERIRDLIFPGSLTEEEKNSMPMVQVVGVDLLATRLTGNKQFNEALFNTTLDLNTEDADRLIGEVHNNLGQLYLGRELKATFQYTGSYLANPWEYENIDADFSKFIKDVKSHHKAVIADPKVDDVYKKQFQNIVDVYDVLEKNYNQVLSKTKYA